MIHGGKTGFVHFNNENYMWVFVVLNDLFILIYGVSSDNSTRQMAVNADVSIILFILILHIWIFGSLRILTVRNVSVVEIYHQPVKTYEKDVMSQQSTAKWYAQFHD
jgi:hypothetical protein